MRNDYLCGEIGGRESKRRARDERKDESEMGKDLVSVIVPVYNTGEALGDCLASILHQTYRYIEVVVTDDCSDDAATLSILRIFAAKDSRVRVFRLCENGGAGVARNNSIREARGRYIAFCDSDDAWFPEKIERQVRFMEERGCRLSYSSYIKCDGEGLGRGIVKCPRRVSFGSMKRDDKIGCLTAIYDASSCGKFFFPTLRKRQDWGMFLNLVQACGHGYGIQEPLAYYRIRKGSISRSKIKLVMYNLRVYRRVLGFSRVKSCLYFAFLFLPSYYVKRVKVKIDSIVYARRRGEGTDRIKRYTEYTD